MTCVGRLGRFRLERAIMRSRHSVQLEAVARRLFGEPNPQQTTEHELRFGTHGSKSINLTNGCWFDHEANVGGRSPAALIRHVRGGTIRDAKAWMRSEMAVADGAAKGNGAREEHPEGNGASDDGSPKPRATAKPLIEETYDYRSAGGELSFQVVRLRPKAFKQRRPDP